MSMVKFVGKDGKSFYECKSAEVRVAIDAIERHRLRGADKRPDYVKDLDLVLANKHEDMGRFDGLFPDMLEKLFPGVEKSDAYVSHIVMHAATYADLLPYQIYESKLDDDAHKYARVATVKTADLFIRSTVRPKVVIAAGFRDGVCFSVSIEHHEAIGRASFALHLERLIGEAKMLQRYSHYDLGKMLNFADAS